MPYVTVKMLEGRTDEQKKALKKCQKTIMLSAASAKATNKGEKIAKPAGRDWRFFSIFLCNRTPR